MVVGCQQIRQVAGRIVMQAAVIAANVQNCGLHGLDETAGPSILNCYLSQPLRSTCASSKGDASAGSRLLHCCTIPRPPGHRPNCFVQASALRPPFSAKHRWRHGPRVSPRSTADWTGSLHHRPLSTIPLITCNHNTNIHFLCSEAVLALALAPAPVPSIALLPKNFAA